MEPKTGYFRPLRLGQKNHAHFQGLRGQIMKAEKISPDRHQVERSLKTTGGGFTKNSRKAPGFSRGDIRLI